MNTDTAWSDLLSWFNGGTHITYKRGEILIRPEDEPHNIYFLKNGHVKVYDLTKGGDENIRIFKRPGDVFPLIWAMRPVQRDSYYQAINTVQVVRRARSDVLEYLQSNPKATFSLLTQMTNMYVTYADRIHNLEFRYARERIAYRMMSLARDYGKATAKGIEITMPLRQLELADTTNVTRETASRELLRLKRKKIIDYHETEYIVLDMDALRKEF